MRITLFKRKTTNTIKATFVDAGISAGFPSPAQDFVHEKLSLDDKLVQNKEATFYARVQGESMINADLHDGDLLVIDRSIPPSDNRIAVCYIENDFTVKRLSLKNNEIHLVPENPNYPTIKISENDNFIIWGIVTYVIKKV